MSYYQGQNATDVTAAAGSGLWGATPAELIFLNTVVSTILSYFLFTGGVKFPSEIVSWETVYIGLTAWIVLVTLTSFVFMIIGKIKGDVEMEDTSAKIIRWGTLPIYFLALLLFFIAMMFALAAK